MRAWRERVAGVAVLMAAVTLAAGSAAAQDAAYKLPKGLEDQELAPIPADNPLTAGKIKLGRAALLRQAAVEDEADVLRDLPRSRKGLDRQPGALAQVRR